MPLEHTLVESHYLSASSGDIKAFETSVNLDTALTDYPLASQVEQNALVYDAATVNAACNDATAKQSLMAEWIKVWLDGPGVLMITGALDHEVVDQASNLFRKIIKRQQENGGGGGDHFAKAGANDRIWNALQKHALEDADNFASYYACDAIAVASEAWLGTGYQLTAQVNCVNPGGAAQSAHRDYHLGFMAADKIIEYPLHVHRLSPVLTLQGAVAHCDMPLESGPTLYLPYSQHFPEGYLAFNRPEFQDYFNENRSQLELKKGDVVFFNPALMHAAGENKTDDISRLANLLQVSSAFGRPIESVDHIAIVKALYPVLLQRKLHNTLSDRQLDNIVCACTDGYPFPTNLDSDLPTNGLAPEAQRQSVINALKNNNKTEEMIKTLEAHAKRQAAIPV